MAKSEKWMKANEKMEVMLRQIKPEDFKAFLMEQEANLIRNERPWADYMRMKLKEKRILQQEVFIAADLPERYGYKLIAEQKHTAQRDIIIRICLAAEFDLDEVQESLILYGMSPLQARKPRDAAFMVAFNNRLYDIHEVDAILRENNLPPFLT